MRRLLVVVSCVALVGCDGFLGRNVVAKAGDQELTVEWFADALVEGDVLLRQPVVERWAWLWVQYSLFIQRVAEGDSLVDSTTVLEAMWPEVLSGTVQQFLERLVTEQVTVDSAVVDSAYNAGDHRLIDHILVRGGGHLSESEQQARLRRATAIRARLAAGGSWDREARSSDDVATRQANGRLGVITWGEMTPDFEEVAFSLEPGELSDVVQTEFGYHIIRRPALDEVREEYARAIKAELEARWRVDFTDDLARQRNVEVAERGHEIIRDAAARPIRVLALEPNRLIGTYDGGRLTDGDFVAWLQALPVQEHEAIEGASDEAVRDMAREAMRWEVLFLEAKSVGTTLTDSLYREAKHNLTQRVARVRGVMRADSALANAAPSERSVVTRRLLDEYMLRILTVGTDIALVPPFLARKLRSEAKWQFSYAGLERAIERAEELEAARDAEDVAEGRDSGR